MKKPILAEISLLKESKENNDMLHNEFQINLTKKVNGNWLADLINKALVDYEKENKTKYLIFINDQTNNSKVVKLTKEEFNRFEPYRDDMENADPIPDELYAEIMAIYKKRKSVNNLIDFIDFDDKLIKTIIQ